MAISVKSRANKRPWGAGRLPKVRVFGETSLASGVLFGDTMPVRLRDTTVTDNGRDRCLELLGVTLAEEQITSCTN